MRRFHVIVTFSSLLLSLSACARTRSDVPAPAPQASDSASSPAAERPVSFRRGVNIAHWLGQNFPGRPYAHPNFDASDVEWIAAQGFDHVRLRVSGGQWVTPDGSLDEAKLAPFFRALEWARAHRLGVVLAMVSLPSFGAEPDGPRTPYNDPELRARAAEFWRLVARRLAAEGPDLRFSALSRASAADDREVDELNHALLAAIRESNPTRVVYLSSNHQHDGRAAVAQLDVPDDPNVVVEFQYHEPTEFTPSGVEQSAANLERAFAEVASWIAARSARKEGYISEWGVGLMERDHTAWRAYVSAYQAAAERNGLGWAVYDYDSGMAIRYPDYDNGGSDEPPPFPGRATPTLEGLSLTRP